MATNPNRPQYKGTIESAWGQSVADHVIRRYATTAERDADLAEAGLTPADLAGQVVAIVPGDGPPYLQLHDGTGWSPAGGRFARVVCDGSTNVVRVAVPPSAMSVRIKWHADSDGAAAQHNVNLTVNDDSTAQYSDTIQWFGTISQVWNRPGPGNEWFVAQLMGGGSWVGGRIEIPFANRDDASKLTTALWECEVNGGGVAGLADPTIMRFQGVGHYWDNLGGVTSSLRLSVSPGNFKAGSIFDFFGD